VLRPVAVTSVDPDGAVEADACGVSTAAAVVTGLEAVVAMEIVGLMVIAPKSRVPRNVLRVWLFTGHSEFV